MTPSTYYLHDKRRKKGYANNFYNHPVVINNLTKYHELNHINPPSNADIKEAHLEVIRINQMNQLSTNAKLIDVIKNVNADFYNPLMAFGNDAQLGIDLIDSALNKHLTNQNFIDNPNNVLALLKQEQSQCDKDISQYMSVLSKIRQLYSYLMTSPFIDDKKIQQYAIIIETAINGLKSSINSYSGSGPVMPATASSKGGYLYDLAYLRYRLQGRYFEVKGINYFGQKLANSIGNFRIVDTANTVTMHYDIFGNATGLKTSGSDAFVIDSSIKINVNGKTMTIGEYLDAVQRSSGDQTITQIISSEQLEAIKSGIVAGMQVKSGKNQQIFNNKETTLNDVIAAASAGNKCARALQLLSHLVTTTEHTHPHFRQTHDHYNALFNYCLAKHLNYIIGKENVIVFTRNGCQTIYDYMWDQYMVQNKMIQAINPVNIHYPDKSIVIGMKKA